MPYDRDRILSFVARHRKPEGGYGWLSRTKAHITPTFAAVGCYRILQSPVPETEVLADFVRSHYPVPAGLSQQPLWRIDYEQAQILNWLGKTIGPDKLAMLQEPFVYNTYFEKNAYPTFQHQAMALRLRKMISADKNLSSAAWRDYFKLRRRTNGTFNNSVAADGSDGHIVNTLWGMGALEDLGQQVHLPADGIAWIRSCQLETGGFIWCPFPALGRCENMIYTWAAVSLLSQANSKPRDTDGCIRWINEQFTDEGGFRSSPLANPNLTATYYALDALRILGASASKRIRPQSARRSSSLPSTLKVYSAQIEAPGNGSPSEAVRLAQSLDIHLWTAKNASHQWIAEAQRIASMHGFSIQFARGDEEYGTYTSVSGFGTYSHLDDLVAPGDARLGPYPPQKDVPLPWTEFRDTRIKAIREDKGRMVWQFNENEELTRILLDEACHTGDYGAISSFHFGLDDFLDFEPFLMEWEGRLAMIGLQDSHGGESWWWTSQLEGFRTLYLAEDPSWESFLKAIDNKWVLSVRRDASTNHQIEWSGALSEVRRFIADREQDWSWWTGSHSDRPLAMLTVLRPNMPFEIGAPKEGLSIRVRLRFGLGDSPNKAVLYEQQSELVSMHIDDREVHPEQVVLTHDRYLLYNVREPESKVVSVVVRDLANGRTEALHADLR
ncbi:Prenyltransferase/squalene oxidase [Terriglobus saanensis SP1PR4]|uniref:Prenyltransferase/squalene oxidase n=1 Tax=Terriglobus saanensis (strain ATCC BAA-1853 / DSM 23119 / SP1PR4) TaxID=401053 RepID=E8V1Y5_TERSS|nr:Prenyltransferase/squalene oxidase [Terriglobus saanensis SP1PR4]